MAANGELSASFHFRQALLFLRVGRVQEAANGFRELIEQGSKDPLHLSHHGLLLATHSGNEPEGLELCERALLLAPDEPQVRLNLARLHEVWGRKDKAVGLLRVGLRQHPRMPALLRAIRQVSPRRRPPIAALDRNHVLNKILGKLRARLIA